MQIIIIMYKATVNNHAHIDVGMIVLELQLTEKKCVVCQQHTQLLCLSPCRRRTVHRHNDGLQRRQTRHFPTLQQRWPPGHQPGLVHQLTGG